MIITGEELIEIIKNKSYSEIKDIFKDYQILSNHHNCFREVLLYLIKNFKTSLNIIEFIIDKQQLKPHLNYYDLLYYSIEYQNFKTAKYFLEKITETENKNENSINILEYINNNFELRLEHLSIILNITKDATLITSQLLCKLILSKNFDVFSFILQYKYYDISFIISLLLIYKNKIPFYAEELENFFNKTNRCVLRINEKNKYGIYPLLQATICNSIDTVKLLITYAKYNNIILDINERDNDEYYPLLCAAHCNNTKMVKLLIEYAKQNNIKLDINNKDKQYGHTPLLCTVKYSNNNTEIVKLLITYAQENNILLEINEKDFDGNYVLSNAVYKENVEIIKLLMDYSRKNNINLKVNECSLFWPTENTEIVKLFMDYANEKKIILNISYDFFWVLRKNNMELAKLFLNYTKENRIVLDIGYSQYFIL